MSRWRAYAGVEGDTVTLVVIGTTAVHCKVEVVDGRAENELAYIVDGFRPRIGDTRRAPGHRTFHKRYSQAVIVGIKARIIRPDVAASGVRPGPVEIDVAVIRRQEM